LRILPNRILVLNYRKRQIITVIPQRILKKLNAVLFLVENREDRHVNDSNELSAYYTFFESL
ncbi:hypothetical protein, partial [Flavobacterium sp. T12S277]|uniref:hypothetical protein n=1 Tax=Flavobacterium sp. T12S277 TaxID=3402752 RepID=UPI003AE1D369